MSTIKTGECASDLFVKDSGPLSNSKMLTWANRILRLYISEAKPLDEIKLVFSYNMKIYATVWIWLDCRINANCPLVRPGPARGVPSLGVFQKNPFLYLRKFWRKTRKASNGYVDKLSELGTCFGLLVGPVWFKIKMIPSVNLEHSTSLNYYWRQDRVLK